MRSKSFTLVEMIVVLGVVALALPALFTVFFVVLQQQAKVYRLSEIKKQGDAVLQMVDSKVRDTAESVWGCDQAFQCGTPENPFVQKCVNPGDTGGYIFKFNCENSACANSSWFGFSSPDNESVSFDQPSGSTDLTESNTIVSNYSFTCYKKDTYSPARVTISFDICYKSDPLADSCNTIRPEEKASLTYSDTIVLR